MSQHFQHIGILGDAQNTGTTETLQALSSYLAEQGHQVIVDTQFAQQTHAPEPVYADKHSLVEQADLVIVIGGDGSMLQAAHLIPANGPPLLGINRGRLGFLTDIYPTELNTKLAQVLSGEYHEEKRFLLQTQLGDASANYQPCGIALNDVVLKTNNVVKMLEFEIYIDNKFVCSQRADGVIAATPTGSTAYTLSGGGPIVQPGLDALSLVTMFPHTLTARPIVISGNSVVDIVVNHDQRYHVVVSCDGQAPIALEQQQLRIQKHNHMLRLIHPLDYNYFATLRTKLHWGTKL